MNIRMDIFIVCGYGSKVGMEVQVNKSYELFLELPPWNAISGRSLSNEVQNHVRPI
jgi:hypothetical protein